MFDWNRADLEKKTKKNSECEGLVDICGELRCLEREIVLKCCFSLLFNFSLDA